MLTKKQIQLLEFIQARMARDGVPPSFDEMKMALDLRSKSGIHRLVTALEERGFIRRLPHRARALEVMKLPEQATAGAPRGRAGFKPDVIEGGARIRSFSHVEGSRVASGAEVGPYARLRPGADLAQGVKVGNFVEVKNVSMAKGAKANHLAYLGDGAVGAGANIGAGTIFCNYDGFNKARTQVGAEIGRAHV